MPRGGTLTVTLKRVERDDDLIRQNRTASPGPWIVLHLEDRGVGMSKEVVDRAFEPFFTTKEPGKGSGLGSPGSMASCGSLAASSRSRVLWELVHAFRSTYRPPTSRSAGKLP